MYVNKSTNINIILLFCNLYFNQILNFGHIIKLTALMCSTEKRSTFRKFVPNDKIHRNDDYVKRVPMPDFSMQPHFTISNNLITEYYGYSKS